MVIGTPFVGRRHELDLLRGKLFTHGLGTARFVGVTGDPGMGKTRLRAEFAAAPADAGVLVAARRPDEFERHVPRGAHSADTLSTVDNCGAIDVERYQLHRAIRTRLVESAVAACRPRQEPPRLSTALSDGVEEIELSALTFAETRELVGEDLDRTRYDAAGGNPLYLEALARHPDAEGNGAPTVELATLGHIDLRVARAAAVVAEPTLVAAAADLPLTETLAAVDRLTDRDLLRPLGTVGGVRYRHRLPRSVVYQGIVSGWRFAAVAYMNTAPSTAAHRLRTALRLLSAEPAGPRAQVDGFCAQIEPLLGRHAEAHALALGELNGLSDPDSAAAERFTRLGDHVDAGQAWLAAAGALAAESLTAEAIARRLGIATRTVLKHLEHSYRKLGVGDRLTSVLRAQAPGLSPRA